MATLQPGAGTGNVQFPSSPARGPQLRPYQQRAVDFAVSLLLIAKTALVIAPTGSGKTLPLAVIAREVSKAHGGTVLIVSHRNEILGQISETLRAVDVDHGVIQAGRANPCPGAPVQVASIQTLVMRRRAGIGIPRVDVIAVDEAHHVAAPTYQAVVGVSEGTLLGFTATPYRSDGKPIVDLFDAYEEVTTIPELIFTGDLVEPRVFGERPPDLGGVAVRAGDYVSSALGKVMACPELVDAVADTWIGKAGGRPTVVFAVNIDHSKKLCAAFAERGVAVAHLDGSTSRAERERILRALAGGTLDVVVNCGVLAEGWDAPFVSAVMLARPTKSRGLWRQMCGRALRPAKGKTDCLIFDHAGCWEEHGFLTDPDDWITEGKDHSGTKRPALCTCDNCGTRLPGRPKHCPICQTLMGTPPVDVVGPVVAAELTELTDYTEQRAFFAELAIHARKHGHKPGWVVLSFKERFGRPPSKLCMGDDPVLHLHWDEAQAACVWDLPGLPVLQNQGAMLPGPGARRMKPLRGSRQVGHEASGVAERAPNRSAP